MQQFFGFLVAFGVGWIVWSLLAPPVQFRIAVRNGRVRVTGRQPPRDFRSIEEFFQDNLSDLNSVRVSVLAPSKQARSRIRIVGSATPGEQQQIRNFLLTRI